MRCVFCEFNMEPASEARYIVDGLSVCLNHVDDADGPDAFNTKLNRLLHREN